MSDVRLIELRLLQLVAAGAFFGERSCFTTDNPQVLNPVRPLDPAEIAVAMLEDLHISCPSNQVLQHLALRLRGEYHRQVNSEIPNWEWDDPREALVQRVRGQACQFAITWRGLHRIEALRSELSSERILERFGILLDMRYYHQDLVTELGRTDRTSLAVLALDLDRFKPINDTYGHKAGDEVLKGYLTAVRDTVGTFGTAYRGVGDEVQIILPGFTIERATALGEAIRAAVKQQRCSYERTELPPVTTSIGVAATPPDERLPSLEDRADERQRTAKSQGRDRVVAG